MGEVHLTSQPCSSDEEMGGTGETEAAVPATAAKLGRICSMGQATDPHLQDPSLPPNLIGDTSEVAATIDNRDCLALVDTGSQVTTIAESFYHQHLLLTSKSL